jgi:mono/diheme cytochrome c family protein
MSAGDGTDVVFWHRGMWGPVRFATLAATVGVVLPSALRLSLAGETAPGGSRAESPAPSPSTILQGYRRFNGACSHCHGPDGSGSTFAPSLVERPIAADAFRTIVLQGAGNGPFVMRGFASDPNVAPYIDAIYAYLDARRRGVVGRGRPPNP